MATERLIGVGRRPDAAFWVPQSLQSNHVAPDKAPRDQELKGCVFTAAVLIYSMSPARTFAAFLAAHEPAHRAKRQNPRAGVDERGFDDEETEMRRTLVALSTAAALIAGSLLFGSNRAEAMITAAPLGQAGQSIDPIEKTACWRLGWRGWGLYPCGYYYGAYPYYYGYGPYYGYGWGPYWGWRSWGWGRRSR